MTTYPNVLRYGVGTANIQNLKDLSRPDTRSALRSVKDQAGKIGFQETIGADDNADIATVFPPVEYGHYGVAGENDVVMRKSRFVPAGPKMLARYQVRARQLRSGLSPELRDSLFDANGDIKWYSVVKMGTGKSGVQPQRNMTVCLTAFVENPLLDPDCFIDTHLISGVDSNKAPVAYRHEERTVQFSLMQELVKFMRALGINCTVVGDMNWRLMPGFTASTMKLVTSTIDKIYFEPAPGANWTLVSLGIERIPNPSDHDAFVCNVELQTNKNYKVSTVPRVPPALPETVEQKFVTLVKKYKITSDAEAELRAVLTEV